ncbi:MAG: 1,4-alpha-glucan branching protein domain-containing protein [Caldisericia bacterium]
MINLMIALHCHIPYVRKRGIWPYGEEWIFESMLESYLPLLMVLHDLSKIGIRNILSISISPILLEQLSDEYIKAGFEKYLENRINLTKMDCLDFSKKGWSNLEVLADNKSNHLTRIFEFWHKISRDIISEFSKFEKIGLIEIGASSATHAILPLLSKKSIEEQIRIGMETLKHRLNITPNYFWLPECAYKLGLEEDLRDAGIKFVFLGSSATTDESFKAYKLGNTDIISVSRQWNLSKMIWSSENGYPGDTRYREFKKRYRRSGNRYWKMTGSKVTLPNKEIFNPDESKSAVTEHIADFISKIKEMNEVSNEKFLLISLDAEVLGHSWFEGVEWLKGVITAAHENESENIKLCTPENVITQIDNGSLDSIRPEICSWGKDGDLRSWDRPAVSWMWEELGTMSSKYFDLTKNETTDKNYLNQLQRELLLSQSSDWPFLVTNKNARVYGERRFRMHSRAFWNIVDMIETGFKDFNLQALLEKDNPFPFLDQPIDKS